jgi:predicted acylesterase/phospholipase RssA
MQYDMVFEGGGAKGTVFVGAIQELEAKGYEPARLLGASAGAIMATFLAAGYGSEEMAAALNEKIDDQPVFLGFLEVPRTPSPQDIQKSAIRSLLRDVNVKLIPDFLEDKLDDALAAALGSSSLTSRVFSFLDKGGMYAADNFLNWLKAKLNAGVYTHERGNHGKGIPRGFGDMNLAEFFTATGADLSLVASDTTDAQLLILNHRTAPDCPVTRAVRMSMSFPLLWEEVVWQPEWGLYRGKDISGHTVVDGGMLSNFPIELFISNQPQVTAVMGEKTTDDLNVMGFLIDESIPVPDAEEAEAEKKGFSFGQLEMVQRINKLVNTMTQAHDKMVIEAFERFVVRLPAKGFGTIEFGMSDKRRDALVAAGRQATAQYLNRMKAAAPGGVSFGLVPDEAVEHLPTADKIATRILGE